MKAFVIALCGIITTLGVSSAIADELPTFTELNRMEAQNAVATGIATDQEAAWCPVQQPKGAEDACHASYEWVREMISGGLAQIHLMRYVKALPPDSDAAQGLQDVISLRAYNARVQAEADLMRKIEATFKPQTTGSISP